MDRTSALAAFFDVTHNFASASYNKIFAHLFNFICWYFCKRFSGIIRCQSKYSILGQNFRTYLERAIIPSEYIKSRKPSDARKSYISLPIFKNVRQIHHSLIQTHALTLVDRNRPGKTKWNLGDPRAHFAVFFDRPIHWLNLDVFTIFCLYDRETAMFVKMIDAAERAIYESIF